MRNILAILITLLLYITATNAKANEPCSSDMRDKFYLDKVYPNNNRMEEMGGRLFYHNRNAILNTMGDIIYPNGTPLKNSVGEHVYPNGNTIFNTFGNFVNPDGEEISDNIYVAKFEIAYRTTLTVVVENVKEDPIQEIKIEIEETDYTYSYQLATSGGMPSIHNYSCTKRY